MTEPNTTSDVDVTSKVVAEFSKYPKRTYPKGQILVFADESPQHIFYIATGKVVKYDVSYRGDEVIVNIFKHPAFFPMSWAINRSPNKFFYKTEEKTELHIVPVEEALAFIKTNPDVMLDLLSRLYKGMDGLMGRVVHLMSGSAKSRLMYELIIECRRFGKKKSDGSITITTNEVDMAARTGLTRETISREIQKLKENGTVAIIRGGIVVLDIEKLEQVLGSEV